MVSGIRLHFSINFRRYSLKSRYIFLSTFNNQRNQKQVFSNISLHFSVNLRWVERKCSTQASQNYWGLPELILGQKMFISPCFFFSCEDPTDPECDLTVSRNFLPTYGAFYFRSFVWSHDETDPIFIHCKVKICDNYKNNCNLVRFF